MTSPATPPPVSSRFPILWRDTQAGRAEQFVKLKVAEMRLMSPSVKKSQREIAR